MRMSFLSNELQKCRNLCKTLQVLIFCQFSSLSVHKKRFLERNVFQKLFHKLAPTSRQNALFYVPNPGASLRELHER